jgi:hypothetical protein
MISWGGKLPTIARKTVLGLPLQRRLLVGVGNLYFGKVVGEFDDIATLIAQLVSSKITRVT